jgi:integrase
MSGLRRAVDEYLAMRRGLGFKLEGLAKLLRSFVSYCEENNIDRVTNQAALAWATSTINVTGHEALYARRMDAVRIFARHRQAFDPATEVPPADVFERRYRPRQPNLFTDDQVAAMLDAADTLTPAFEAATWRTVIGLLAVTGMRPGEAMRLRLGDVNLADGVIRVEMTKFGKSRIVFLHPTACMAMSEYLQIRGRWISARRETSDMFFTNTNAAPVTAAVSSRVFRQIIAVAQIPPGPGQRPPRLHDLRHTFVVNTMLGWYRDGVDVEQRLTRLSTWLGHVDPASTYWYTHAVPELLQLAAGRLARPTGHERRAP